MRIKFCQLTILRYLFESIYGDDLIINKCFLEEFFFLIDYLDKIIQFKEVPDFDLTSSIKPVLVINQSDTCVNMNNRLNVYRHNLIVVLLVHFNTIRYIFLPSYK